MDTKQCAQRVFSGKPSDRDGHPCTLKAKIFYNGAWWCVMHGPNSLIKRRKRREGKDTRTQPEIDHVARQQRAQRDADAKLGALVRAMPTNRNLTTDGLGTWRVYTDDDLLVGSGNTPEDALKVAGVVLGAVA